VDNNSHLVTVAVVDRFGELVIHKDFLHLMPPRSRVKQQMNNEEDKERLKKLKQTEMEEMSDHVKDVDNLKLIIQQNQVDLIVVGANKLEARKIFEKVKEIASSLKDLGEENQVEEEQRKEAIVIWGNLEIPKLLSVSHQSQRLLKNCNPILKQCVSMARFQQDPLPEILNLWSQSPSENQILQSNLHPLQRLVN